MKKKKYCLHCGSPFVDRAHVKTRGSGGGDEDWNIMFLCREAHIEQHKLGIATFAMKYDSVMDWLIENGWELEVVNGCRNPIYRVKRSAGAYKRRD
jgi:hypothetical protein